MKHIVRDLTLFASQLDRRHVQLILLLVSLGLGLLLDIVLGLVLLEGFELPASYLLKLLVIIH